jgi:ornithine cyclodeaminase/alanine dehydrogenase-like protein (mu-crystallin family)
MPPVYVTEGQVENLLTPADARTAVHGSLERTARGAVENPSRVRTDLPGGVFAVMPCVDRELGYAGLKTYTWLPNGTPFLVVLFSIERAEVTAILEADTLGRRRTAAASAVAAQSLARDGATTLGVIGCGRQAASHVVALREALPSLDRVLVHCRTEERLTAFCGEHGCEAASAQAAAACDIVVTATTAQEPVLHGAWLRDGATVLAVGANDPAARELDELVMERATFVCTDAREQARHEAGDLIDAAGRGGLDWADVGELHEVVTAGVRGRQSDDDIVVFKSNGLAAWDLAAAARVVELLGPG